MYTISLAFKIFRIGSCNAVKAAWAKHYPQGRQAPPWTDAAIPEIPAASAQAPPQAVVAHETAVATST